MPRKYLRITQRRTCVTSGLSGKKKRNLSSSFSFGTAAFSCPNSKKSAVQNCTADFLPDMFLKKAVYDNRKWGSEEKDNQQGNGIEADEFLLVGLGVFCGAGPLFVKQQPG